jgi:hypothetical protein
MEQQADLYALLCNLLGAGKKSWSREDFMAKGGEEKAPPAEVQAGLQKYHDAIAAQRVAYRKKKRGASGE